MRRLEMIRTARSVARADRLKPQVLVVDDDPVNVALLEKHLMAGGYPVLKAYDGVQALKVMEAHAPQILILDWVMPGMDGPAVCRTVRSLRTAGFLYIIMLTVHSAKKRLVEAFDAGVDDFLTKPFDGDELMARLRAGPRDRPPDRAGAANPPGAPPQQPPRAAQRPPRGDGPHGRPDRFAEPPPGDGAARDQWAIADRYDLPLSLLMIDIDDFKKINDSYGHATGDAVLREVAGVLRQTVRATDAACRVGGEEFLVILPNEGAAGAAIAAERIRRAVSTRSMFGEGPAINVTVSVGAAHRHMGMTGHDDLLRQADGALYAAKHSGKNRVYVARDEAAYEEACGPLEEAAPSPAPAAAAEPKNHAAPAREADRHVA